MAIRLLSSESVDGSATIETGINLESGTLVIKNATGDSSGLKIFQDSSDASKIHNNYNGTLQLGVNNATTLTLDSSEATFGTIIYLPDGSATAPSIGNTGDANTGMYWPGNHQLGFAVNGSRKMYMSETKTFFQNQANGVEINNGLNVIGETETDTALVTDKLGIGAINNSFNLYNNGTTYLNGNTTVDATFTVSNTATTSSVSTVFMYGKRTNSTDGAIGEIIYSNNGDSVATLAGFRDGADDKGSLVFQTQNGSAGFGTRLTIAAPGDATFTNNLTFPDAGLSSSASATNFGVYTSEIRLIDTPNGGLKQCRVITDNYGEWVLVGRFAASAMTTIQSIWSSESGLDTSTSQSTTTKFSADFGDSYPTEVRIMGATDFTKWRDTRTVDFVYGVPEGRAWKYFFSGGAENGMTSVGPNHSGNNKYGWNINGSYDGFGRWVNPAQTSVGMSDANITNPSAAYTTATTNAFNWESASDAKITVSATRTFSGQDSFVTAGFGNDDNIQGFFDEYPNETNNMQGGVDFSSAVWVLIKLPTAISSGSGGGSGNQWAGGPTTIHNTNTGSVGIGTSNPGVTGKGLEIQNIGNDTTASLKLTGHNNTGTPGAATSTELKHIGDSLKFAINHNGTDALTIGSSASTIGFTLSNTTELGTYPTGAVKRIRMVQGGEIHFGDTTTASPLGVTEGVWDNFGDQDSLGIYSRNHFSVYSYGGTYSNPKLRIDDAGSYFQGSNFGIGVTNPTSGNLVLPQEESNQFKIAFTGASSSSGISTVDQSGSGLYIGANSRVNNSGVITYHDSALDSSGIYFDGWNGNDMEFYTALSGAPQKRMVIDGYGRVNVYQQMCVGGTTAPTNEKLLVQSGLGNGSEIWRFGTSGRYTFTGHKFFNSITGTATSDGWYTIGNVGDSSSVIINIQTAAHSTATILASRGYGPSNVATVQVLSSTKNANSGYANIKAVRINAGGLIDMQLYWTSGPNVSVHLAYYGLGCDMPTTLALSVGGTGTYPYNITDTATFRSTAASARVSGEFDVGSQIHAGSNINVYSTSRIYFHATSNSDQYIGATSTNDLEIGAGDDINYRSNFSRFFSGTTEHARLTGLSGSNNWLANGTNNKLGISNTSPQTTLHTGPTTTVTNAFTARFAASNFFASGGNSMFYVPDTAANIMMFGSNQFGTNQIEFYHKNPGTSQAYVGRISTSGSATSYVTSSDYRLKENIVPISESISRLNQLKPSRFNFIEEPGKVVDGFIAHEVQDIVPEAIVGEKDEVDEEGGIVPQGIDQAKLVPLLVAAVQELEARVKELENK